MFAEAGGVASWEEGEGFEDDAMFGILPVVGAELGEDGCTFGGKGGWIVCARRWVGRGWRTEVRRYDVNI